MVGPVPANGPHAKCRHVSSDGRCQGQSGRKPNAPETALMTRSGHTARPAADGRAQVLALQALRYEAVLGSAGKRLSIASHGTVTATLLHKACFGCASEQLSITANCLACAGLGQSRPHSKGRD
jgi:hypothetical protein